MYDYPDHDEWTIIDVYEGAGWKTETVSLSKVNKLYYLLSKYIPAYFEHIIYYRFTKKNDPQKISFALTDRDQYKPNHESEEAYWFAKNLQETEDPHLETIDVAGFPVKFELKEFMRWYADKLEKEKMREILSTLHIKKTTINSYLEEFKEMFKKPDIDVFIEKFRGLAKEKVKKCTVKEEKYIHELSEVENATGFSAKQIVSFHDSGQLPEDIKYHKDMNKFIYYRE